jgi:hypothetical protein
VILQAAAMTNAQALFLVSAVNVVTFYALGMILRERGIARISLISLVAAVTMLVPFLAADSGSTRMIILLLRSTSSIAMSLGVLGFVLAVTRIGDRLLQLVPDTASVSGENSRLDRLSELVGLLLSGGVALYWTALSFWNALRPESSSVTWIHCLLPLTTFAVHTLRYRNLLSGFVFWALMLTGSVYVAVETNMSWEMFSSCATVVLGIGSIAGHLWFRSNRSNSKADVQLSIRNAFLVPFNWLSTGVMFVMTELISLPMLMYHNLNQSAIPMPLTTTMTVVWLIAATLFLNSRIAGLLSALITPLLASVLVVTSGLISHLSWTQIFVIWATTSSACSILFSLMRSPSTELALMISRAWMLGTLAVSTTSFNHEYRIVPAVVLPALLLVNRETLSGLQRTILAILANVHGLLLLGGSMGLQGVATTLFASPDSNLLRLYFAALTISVFVFEYLRTRLEEDLVEVWQVILRICGGLAVFTSLLGESPTPVMSVITIATFSAAAVFEFWNAVRRQEELYIWNAIVLIAGCGGWMIAERLIVPGAGMSQILLMVLSAITLTVAESHETISVPRFLSVRCESLVSCCPWLFHCWLCSEQRWPAAMQEACRHWRSLAVRRSISTSGFSVDDACSCCWLVLSSTWRLFCSGEVCTSATLSSIWCRSDCPCWD